MFIGTSISTSPVIAAAAGAAIEKGAGKAVKFDGNGNIVLCSTAGEAALGVLILQHADKIAAGDTVTVQIERQGQALAGGTIAAGDLLAVNASGAVVKAGTGNYVIGQALSAGVAGGFVNIQIIKGGQLN